MLPGLGARLHRLRVGGHELLRTPRDVATHQREPFLWGAYVMAPWANRVAAGPVQALGKTVDLPANAPDSTALHGLVYDRPWDEVGEGRFRIEHGGAGGWPWPFVASIEYSVVGLQLRVGLRLDNLADEAAPGGLGLHPWFRLPVSIAIRARRVYPSNQGPPMPSEPVHGPFDRRRLGPLAVGVDAAWTDVDEPAALLAWPQLGLSGELRFQAPGRLIVAAALAGVDAAAVEPQTHAPQGLRRLLDGDPDGLAILPPGGTLQAQIALQVHPR